MKWEPSGDKCPKCKKETEIQTDGEYEYAERCKRCKWKVEFPG